MFASTGSFSQAESLTNPVSIEGAGEVSLSPLPSQCIIQLSLGEAGGQMEPVNVS